MASKPNISLARWADQIGANLLTPSSGLRDLGFQAGTAAVSGYVNTEINQLYQWALYLSDGALSGNHTIAGTLGTSGALTVSAGGAAITGNSTVTGTLGVTGASTQAAITASGLITANAGITAGANQHVTVSGTGRFKHGTLELDAAMKTPTQYTSGAFGVPGNPPIASSISGTGATSGWVSYFELPVGKRIVNVKAVVQESTSGGTDKAQVSLFRASNTGAWTLVGTGSPSAGNNTVQTILFNANHTVLTATTYALVVNFAAGSAAININRTFVEYDES